MDGADVVGWQEWRRVNPEQTFETMYGSNDQGEHYNSITRQIPDLRDRVWHHLEN